MTLTAVILVVSLLWLLMGSIINKLQQLWLSEPMIALVTGIVMGPMLHWIMIPAQQEHSLLEWSAKITIAMALMSSALKFKHIYILSHKQMLSVLVVGGMLLMFGLSALIARYTFHLSWPVALLIGAIVTPTDPVVSASMISSRFADRLLNNNIKSSLYFESGINDGLAYPLVAIGWMLVEQGEMDWLQWLQKTVVYENLLAILIGSVMGYVAGVIMHYAHQARLMNNKTLLSYSIGLTLLVLSFLDLINMNGIIGVFFAGLLYNRSIKKEEDLEEERVQETIERLVTIPVFFLLGLVLPWEAWKAVGWPLLWFVVLILLFRRLPAIILLKPFLSRLSRWPRILLVGWFGPIGVAALFYSIITMKEAGYSEAFPVVAAVIAGSVLVHGVTGVPFLKLYHRHDKMNVPGDSGKENDEEKEKT